MKRKMTIAVSRETSQNDPSSGPDTRNLDAGLDALRLERLTTNFRHEKTSIVTVLSIMCAFHARWSHLLASMDGRAASAKWHPSDEWIGRHGARFRQQGAQPAARTTARPDAVFLSQIKPLSPKVKNQMHTLWRSKPDENNPATLARRCI